MHKHNRHTLGVREVLWRRPLLRCLCRPAPAPALAPAPAAAAPAAATAWPRASHAELRCRNFAMAACSSAAAACLCSASRAWRSACSTASFARSSLRARSRATAFRAARRAAYLACPRACVRRFSASHRRRNAHAARPRPRVAGNTGQPTVRLAPLRNARPQLGSYRARSRSRSRSRAATYLLHRRGGTPVSMASTHAARSAPSTPISNRPAATAFR
jgi:hypothetical protein|eukprot:COSAG01_NODE_10082_length_2253_cov_11.910399_2_plen_217_part_00